MTDTIAIIKDVPEVRANLIPMHIQYSGQANTEDYFTPSKNNEKAFSGDCHIAYFRGCKLVGNELGIQKFFDGYLLNHSESLVNTEAYSEDGGNDTFDNVKSVKVHAAFAHFDEITIYGHDSLPELDSQWAHINEWKEVSDIIHS